jgi:nitric oxide reductase activation protein
VEELYSTGVLTYCLTLDPQADAYVKRIFGENNYTIVDNVNLINAWIVLVFPILR